MMQYNRKTYNYLGIALVTLAFSACVAPYKAPRNPDKTTPDGYYVPSQDTVNSAKVKWRDFFTDPYLNVLIDSALKNNQEYNIIMEEISIAKNEIRARKGEYLPFVNINGAAGAEKVGEYTSKGSSEATTDIKPGTPTPDPLPDFMLGAYASWEIDIWKKLRNAKKSAVARYLATIEGRNYMVTNLVAEIASSYYELLALDNQLTFLKQNIEIQTNALQIVKIQKQAARVTELPVRKFEAEVLNTKSLQYIIQQRIIETENRINFLVGRYPQPVQRNPTPFKDLIPETVYAGLPSQLLDNRPDVRAAEQELVASY